MSQHARSKKPKDKWTVADYDEWVCEAAAMFNLAQQNSAIMDVEAWREAYAARRAERERACYAETAG